MAVMSHHHTAGFRKLREGLTAQTKVVTNRGLKIEQLNEDFEAEKKQWAEDKAALEKKLKGTVRQRGSVVHT